MLFYLFYRQTVNAINSYMIRKKIKPELQTRIREYLKFIYMDKHALNMEEEEKIINSLSASLKEELFVEAYGDFLKANRLFTNNFSEETLKKMIFCLKEVSFTPGDVIYLVIREK